MGLDGVELVCAVEEKFQIALSDSDAAQCVTVGKLVDLVLSRLRQSAQEPCASQRGFYIVRRHLMSALGLPRAQIRPETRLDELIGREDRRERWRVLIASLAGSTVGCPALVRPRWLTIALLVLVAVTGLGLAAWWVPFALACLAAISVGLLGHLLTVPLRREFPRRFSEVRHLIPLVTTLDPGTWSEDEVFRKVRAIVIEQLGVKESQVTREARFVEDLGAG